MGISSTIYTGVTMLENYEKLAMRTATTDYQAVMNRYNFEMVDLVHASLGLTTEASEFADVIKKTLYYGKELDKVNLAEELSDMFWYCALACKVLEVDFEKVMLMNIKKLQKRYPEGFTEVDAINRNLDEERKQLELDI